MKVDHPGPTRTRQAATFGAATGAAYALVAVVLAMLEFGHARIDSPARVPLAFVVLPLLGAVVAVGATWIREAATSWAKDRALRARPRVEEPTRELDLTLHG